MCGGGSGTGTGSTIVGTDIGNCDFLSIPACCSGGTVIILVLVLFALFYSSMLTIVTAT